MHQAAAQSTTRRALLSAPPVIAAVALAPPAHGLSPDAELLRLARRLDDVCAIEAKLMASEIEDPALEQSYYELAHSVVEPILKARATTWEGLQVKARVLLWAAAVKSAEAELEGDELCTNERAALSIVRDLLGN